MALMNFRARQDRKLVESATSLRLQRRRATCSCFRLQNNDDDQSKLAACVSVMNGELTTTSERPSRAELQTVNWPERVRSGRRLDRESHTCEAKLAALVAALRPLLSRSSRVGNAQIGQRAPEKRHLRLSGGRGGGGGSFQLARRNKIDKRNERGFVALCGAATGEVHRQIIAR